jgi:hypothetical protein
MGFNIEKMTFSILILILSALFTITLTIIYFHHGIWPTFVIFVSQSFIVCCIWVVNRKNENVYHQQILLNKNYYKRKECKR